MRVSGRDAAPMSRHPIRRQFTGAELGRQHLFVDRDRAVRRDHASARVRELALLTNHEPITDYIRPAVHTYPGVAFVIAVVIGILVGHFLWGPAYGRTSPVGKK